MINHKFIKVDLFSHLHVNGITVHKIVIHGFMDTLIYWCGKFTQGTTSLNYYFATAV